MAPKFIGGALSGPPNTTGCGYTIPTGGWGDCTNAIGGGAGASKPI